MSLFGTGRLGLSAGCRRRSMVLLHIPDTLVGRLVLPRGRGALGRGGRDGGLADQGKSHRKNDGKNRGKDFLHFCLLADPVPWGSPDHEMDAECFEPKIRFRQRNFFRAAAFFSAMGEHQITS